MATPWNEQEYRNKLQKVHYERPIIEHYVKLAREIRKRASEKNAIILAHYYQRPEIQFLADFVGDSLELSKKAKDTDADIILFCGVHFMAETAKILNPKKKVLLPALDAGCSLAESITPEDVKRLRKEHPDAAVVTYINTSAALKAECDVCCTSANVVKIITSVPQKEVIFVPDEYMGDNIANCGKKIYKWNGKCIVHEQFTPEHITSYKRKHPGVKVLSHLECSSTVAGASDLSGSTSQIRNYIRDSDSKQFLVLTECDMGTTLAQEFPQKEFLTPCILCPYMKKITIEKVLDTLKEDKHVIDVPEDVRVRALRSIDKMFALMES